VAPGPSPWLVRRLAAALLFALGLGVAAHAAPLATVDTGRLEGAVEGGAEVFRGVPFAAPPVGPLRWRPPAPAAAWSGTRKAVAYGPDCLQPAMTDPPGPGFINPMSEDCLYLNVWRPAARSAKPLPVMVWIYGGAFIMGAGSYPEYDGAHFAEQGVVLVTLNYRVGLFGFFAHPALSAETPDGPLANYGLMDQIAALKWVRRNIAAFGGDPANVTIFGESAGGVSVNTLLVSPPARGLFAKAISESGGGRGLPGTSAWAPMTGAATSAEARGKAWAVSVGVAGDDPAALRAIPADVVLKGTLDGDVSAPIVDGRIVPERLDLAMNDGRQAVVPYLVGANSDEQSLLRWMPTALAHHQQALGPFRDEAMRLYGRDGKVDADTAARALWGDMAMVGPARFLARRMTAAGAPTFLYHYAYVPKATRATAPGAPHSAEINLVFANEGRVSMFGEGEADAPTADLMHAYWIAFARTGDPNGAGRPRWPLYSPDSDTLLDFTNAGVLPVKDFDKPGLDLLDRVYQAEQAAR
jgi:para-nitrobenzyl esterase